MLRYVQIAFAAMTAMSLAVVGWAQLAGPADGGGQTNSPSGVARIRVTEADFLKQLNLNNSQWQQYSDLKDEVAAEYKKVGLLEPLEARLKRASEIAYAREAAIKNILTANQYKKYDKWIEDSISKGAGVFSGTDEQILNKLSLTQNQWKQYREFRERLSAMNHRLYRLNRTDAMGAGWFSTQINREANTGIQKILTPAQWKQYKEEWERIMSPHLGKGGGTPPRSLGGGG